MAGSTQETPPPAASSNRSLRQGPLPILAVVWRKVGQAGQPFSVPQLAILCLHCAGSD